MHLIIYGFTDSRREMAEWVQLVCNLASSWSGWFPPDQKWEWLGRSGPTSCAVCATHTRHIEIKLTPCTMSHLGVHQTEDPHGRERLYHTLYSLGGRVRTRTPTVLNHSKMYNSCWCRQFSNHRHTCCNPLPNTCPQSHLYIRDPLASLTVN